MKLTEKDTQILDIIDRSGYRGITCKLLLYEREKVIISYHKHMVPYKIKNNKGEWEIIYLRKTRSDGRATTTSRRSRPISIYRTVAHIEEMG